MMRWLSKLFGESKPPVSFRRVDWLNVDQRWRTIEAMAKSSDQTAKKQVLIQADMLIDGILKQANVPGATMGERLRNLRNQLDRSAYQMLWQAHLKRNELVHDDTSFVADWEIERHFQSFKQALSEIRRIR